MFPSKKIEAHLKFYKDHLTLYSGTGKMICGLLKQRLNCSQHYTYCVKKKPQSNMKTTSPKRKFKSRWLVQYNNDPNHWSKSTTGCFGYTKSVFWSGSVRAQDLLPEEVLTSRELLTPAVLKIRLSWSSSVRKNCPESPLDVVHV